MKFDAQSETSNFFQGAVLQRPINEDEEVASILVESGCHAAAILSLFHRHPLAAHLLPSTSSGAHFHHPYYRVYAIVLSTSNEKLNIISIHVEY